MGIPEFAPRMYPGAPAAHVVTMRELKQQLDLIGQNVSKLRDEVAQPTERTATEIDYGAIEEGAKTLLWNMASVSDQQAALDTITSAVIAMGFKVGPSADGVAF